MAKTKKLKEHPEKGLFLLPGGYLTNDGECFREVEIRHLTGREEEMMADTDDETMLASLFDRILVNCVKRIGTLTKINLDVIKNLIVPDRDYLLLCLRRFTFGNRVEARLRCPNEQCNHMSDIGFDLDEIQIQRNQGNGTFSAKLSSNTTYKDKTGAVYDAVQFRLPTAGDQEEAVSIMQNENQSKALTYLFTKCIQKIGKIEKIDEDFVHSLPISTRREIELQIKRHSPTVDLSINVTCPRCNYDFKSPFDIQNFFLTN